MSTSGLEPLIGAWRAQAWIPSLGEEPILGSWAFNRDLGDTAVLQRTAMDHPAAPDTIAVITPDGDGFRQHYFDSRGVVRLYRMGFDGTTWTLDRGAPDFSALPFHQRFVGVLDGDMVRGRWERSVDGTEWDLDFELALTRVSD